MGTRDLLLVIIAAAVLVLAVAQVSFCQWQHSGLDSSQVDAVIFRAGDAEIAYAAKYGSGEGVFKSTDGGLTWSLSHAWGMAHGLAVGPVGSDAVYAIFTDAIFRSLDAGTTWVRKNEGFDFYLGNSPSDIAVNPQHPDSVYLTTGSMVGGGGFYCSRDQGNNWNRIDMPYINWKGPIGLDPLNTARIFVAEGWDGPLIRTLDGGSSWEGVYPDVIEDIAINPLNPDVVYITVSGDSAVYRSADGGDTWTGFGEEAGLLVWASVLAVNPVNPAIVYAGSRGICRSEDGGTTWSDFSTGLPEDAYVQSIAIDSEFGTTLLVGTVQHGIYRRDESLAGAHPKTDSGHFNLVVNPNPFTSETAISYQLTKASEISISIYSVAGQQVSILTDARGEAGPNQTTWDGRDCDGNPVGPGIYYVDVRTSGGRDIKTIVLLR